jgi:AraC-like DNA-binding protein
MNFSKQLSNGNKIIFNTTQNLTYTKHEEYYAMKAVFKGKEDCITDNRKLSLYPDGFAMLNKDTKYRTKIESAEPVETLTVMFSNDFIVNFHKKHTEKLGLLLSDTYSEAEFPSFIESIYPLYGDLKYNLFNLKNKIQAGLDNDALINEYLHHCLINYYTIYHNEIIVRSEKLEFVKQKTKLEVMKRLVVAKEFICNNYDRNITLDEIARTSCLSCNHLLRRFKEAYNISPFNYLMRVRLSRASHLLAHTSYSVRQIVGMVGFECPSSFARLFRKNFKTQPLDYRRLSRN